MVETLVFGEFVVDLTDPNIILQANNYGNFLGTAASEQIYASHLADVIDAEGGDDVIFAGVGQDDVDGGDGNDTIYGGDDADFLKGRDGDDVIYGGEGYDDIWGGYGDDVIYGGEGIDEITDNFGYNIIYAGDDKDLVYSRGSGEVYLEAGDDEFYGSNQSYQAVAGDGIYVDGGEGNDWILGSLGDDVLYGGDGSYQDSLFGYKGDDVYLYNVGSSLVTISETHKISGTVVSGDGNDTILFGAGIDLSDVTIWGSVTPPNNNGMLILDVVGARRIEINHQLDDSLSERHIEQMEFADGKVVPIDGHYIVGTSGNDDDASAVGLYGTADIDIIDALSGDDIVYAGVGNDTVIGRAGDDTLYGEAGADYLFGEEGADWIVGGSGHDTIYGGIGNDTLRGADDNDTLYGEAGADDMQGGDGDDTLYGGDDNDTLRGEAGADYLYGDAGNDNLYGYDGADVLYGGDGGDKLFANEGDDTLDGGEGNDKLWGQDGSDQMTGGVGSDRFYFLSGDTGLDTISDFDAAEGDMLDISHILSSYDPLTDVLTDFVQITDDGVNTTVMVDADGGADQFVAIAYLSNVTGLTDEAALEASGTLIVA